MKNLCDNGAKTQPRQNTELLPEFSSNQFETMHRCYEHIEDVHVTCSRQENHFRQNYGIMDLDNF